MKRLYRDDLFVEAEALTVQGKTEAQTALRNVDLANLINKEADIIERQLVGKIGEQNEAEKAALHLAKEAGLHAEEIAAKGEHIEHEDPCEDVSSPDVLANRAALAAAEVIDLDLADFLFPGSRRGKSCR